MRSIAGGLEPSVKELEVRIVGVKPAALTSTILSRLQELTIWGNSDLTRLLIDIREGSAAGVLISLAYVNEYLVGWAAVDKWRHYVLMNVYVDDTYRGRGIGTKLVRSLIEPYKKEYDRRPYVEGSALRFYMRAAPELFAMPKLERTS